MSGRRRARAITAVSAAVAVLVAAGAAGATAAFAGSDDTVALAPLVASWPDAYTVTGTKAEALYTERITVTRSGARFAVRIEALGQGDAAMGTQRSAVTVTDGEVVWTSGCTKTAAECAADPALRGFLATAAVVALAESDRLPATGIRRSLHGTDVVCVSDAELHPDAAPAMVELDPCLDPATGAVLGHWSPDSEAFVGATLAAGFRVTTSPDLDLFPST